MQKNTRKTIRSILICAVSFLTSASILYALVCSQKERTVTTDHPEESVSPSEGNKEYPSDYLSRLQAALEQDIGRYLKEHPADVSFPVSAEEEADVIYPLSYRDEIAYGILSKGIAFRPIVWEEASARFVLPVYGLTGEKARWLSSELLTDPLFREDSFLIISAEGDYAIGSEIYTREEPSSAELTFYQALQEYERQYPGSVTVSWTGPIRIRTHQKGMEKELSLYCHSDADGTFQVTVPYLSTAGEQWLREQICGGDAVHCNIQEGGKVLNDLTILLQNPDRLEPSVLPNNSSASAICDLDMAPFQNTYSVSEERISFRISNRSEKTVYYSMDLVFDVLVHDTWYSVPRLYEDVPYGTQQNFSCIPVPPGKNVGISLNLCEFAFPAPGTYRITQRFYPEQFSESWQEKSIIFHME